MNVLCNNKKFSFKYSVIKKIEAGLVLSGWEVKSLKDGNGQLSESYISITKDEIFLCNAHIKIVNMKNSSSNQNPTCRRKLLLNRKEINMLQGQVSQKGLSNRFGIWSCTYLLFRRIVEDLYSCLVVQGNIIEDPYSCLEMRLSLPQQRLSSRSAFGLTVVAFERFWIKTVKKAFDFPEQN